MLRPFFPPALFCLLLFFILVTRRRANYINGYFRSVKVFIGDFSLFFLFYFLFILREGKAKVIRRKHDVRLVSLRCKLYGISRERKERKAN